MFAVGSEFTEVWVFVEDIVEICNFPVEWCLVLYGQYLKEIEPSQICFKSDNILGIFLVCASKEDSRIVLVLYI